MIGSYLIDDVTIRNLVSLDQWNTPTYTDVAVKARVDWQDRLIRNAQGEQVVSAALVYFDNDVAGLTIDDRITIDGVEHAIMRVDKKTDFSTSHYEVWIQ
ncbi:MAG: hypothetical protein M0R06_03180 [Sphaerochaeta sp.]|jgi:hypothetical protein|nr:hypothetical protein [Sphaerochaeta sp.]